MAASLSLVKPKCMAAGRKSAVYPTSFKNVQASTARILEKAFLNSSAPPIAISPRGVAVLARFPTVVERILGMGRREQGPDGAGNDPKDYGIGGNPFQSAFDHWHGNS